MFFVLNIRNSLYYRCLGQTETLLRREPFGKYGLAKHRIGGWRVVPAEGLQSKGWCKNNVFVVFCVLVSLLVYCSFKGHRYVLT